LVEAGNGTTIKVHHTEQTNKTVLVEGGIRVLLTEKPYDAADDDYIYVMRLDERGEVYSEPYLGKADMVAAVENGETAVSYTEYKADGSPVGNDKNYAGQIFYGVTIPTAAANRGGNDYTHTANPAWKAGEIVLVDFYVEETSSAFQVEITPDKFGGNYYLEASTLFRTPEGEDLAAEFVIPNCKIQSNFTFTMASSGDPSSFTFTMDAFPDYTRFDKTKKVLAAIQVVDHLGADEIGHRKATPSAGELYL
jgi:hypothetical protein